MSGTVSAHQQSSFTSPVNGDPLQASVPLGNDNTMASTYNTHDADYTIHVQQSGAAARPAAGTAGQMWMTTDTFILAYDNGVTWNPAKVAAADVNAGTLTGAFTITGALTLQSTLAVSGAANLNGTVTLGDAITDALTFTGRVASSILPITSGLYDLGSTALRFNTGWFNSNVTVGGGVTIGASLSVGTTTAFGNDITLSQTSAPTASAGGGSLPTLPIGFLVFTNFGVTIKVPYYGS